MVYPHRAHDADIIFPSSYSLLISLLSRNASFVVRENVPTKYLLSDVLMRNGVILRGIFRPKTWEKFLSLACVCVCVALLLRILFFSFLCSLSAFSLAFFMCQNTVASSKHVRKKNQSKLVINRISELNSSSHLSLFSLLLCRKLYYNSPLEERKRERERTKERASISAKESVSFSSN